jgi:hypothetical protein
MIRVRIMVLNTTFTIPGVPNSFGGWNDKDLHISLVNVRFNNVSVKPVASFRGNGTNIAIWIACPKPGTGFPTSYVVVFI